MADYSDIAGALVIGICMFALVELWERLSSDADYRGGRVYEMEMTDG